MEPGTNEIHVDNTNNSEESSTETVQVSPHETEAPTTETPAPLADQFSSATEDKETTSSHWGQRALIIGGASVALVAAGVGIFTLGARSKENNAGAPVLPNSDKQTSAVPTTASSPSTDVTQAPSPSSTEALVGPSFPTIESISPSMSTDKMANAVLTEAFSDWSKAGVSGNLVQAQQASGMNVNDYASLIASNNAALYANALFTENWKNDLYLSAYVDQLTKENARNISLAILTANDSEPFTQTVELNSVEVGDQNQSLTRLIILFKEHNNATKNQAGTTNPELIPDDTAQKRINVRLVPVGNVMKISSIEEYTVQ